MAPGLLSLFYSTKLCGYSWFPSGAVLTAGFELYLLFGAACYSSSDIMNPVPAVGITVEPGLVVEETTVVVNYKPPFWNPSGAWRATAERMCEFDAFTVTIEPIATYMGTTISLTVRRSDTGLSGTATVVNFHDVGPPFTIMGIVERGTIWIASDDFSREPRGKFFLVVRWPESIERTEIIKGTFRSWFPI